MEKEHLAGPAFCIVPAIVLYPVGLCPQVWLPFQRRKKSQQGSRVNARTLSNTAPGTLFLFGAPGSTEQYR